MCNPMALAVGSLAMTGVQAYAGMQAGKAEAAGYEREAYSIETKRIDVRTQTSQAARDRALAYEDALHTNNAAIAVSGLSYDSFSASLAENRRRLGQDIQRIHDQGDVKDDELMVASAVKRDSAKATRRNAKMGALMTMGKGLYNFGLNVPGGSALGRLFKME